MTDGLKIIAVLTLWTMCYLLARRITIASVPPEDYFLWGWVVSVVSGFLINWFVKVI